MANKLDFHQMDVKSAFLNTDLEENVHISCPKGVKLKQGLFLPLNKALYGLKQAPLAWYNWFLSWSQKVGFVFLVSGAGCETYIFNSPLDTEACHPTIPVRVVHFMFDSSRPAPSP